MTDWKEINRISKDPQGVRSLAKRLLKLPYITWPEERMRFLKDMARESDPITTRQAEYLIDLRDETELHSKVAEFSVASLIGIAGSAGMATDIAASAKKTANSSRASRARRCSRGPSYAGCSRAAESSG